MGTFEDGKNKIEKGEYAYQYYINKGLTPIMAAAIVGNLAKESNFNTSVLGTADNKGSVGIAQWHSDRLSNLKKFAGSNWKSLDRQLDFVLHELSTTEQKAFNSLRNAKTVEEATTSFMNDYERPSSNPKINRIGDRITEALKVSGKTLSSTMYLPQSSFDTTVKIGANPLGLETSTAEYKEPEEPEVTEAKQEIAKKSFYEDLSKLVGAQQEQQVQQAAPQQEQDFIPSDLPDPYNYIQQDPGYNFEEFQNGGKVIEDDRGQWAHPGEITKINSSNITMKGVGYPVLGVDNLGNSQMMYPNEDYKFPGEFVTEYPQHKQFAQKGLDFKLKDERLDSLVQRETLPSFKPKNLYEKKEFTIPSIDTLKALRPDIKNDQGIYYGSGENTTYVSPGNALEEVVVKAYKKPSNIIDTGSIKNAEEVQKKTCGFWL